MALSAQTGYIMSLKSMMQQKKLIRKVTMLRVGNTYNKPLQKNNSSIWSL